jgi:tryptophan-rich hypothetical protein
MFTHSADVSGAARTCRRTASSGAMTPTNDDHRAQAPAPAEAPKVTRPKNPLSPKKLLLTKWTAVAPRHKEKHFVVTRVIEPEPPEVRIDQIELEAVHSKRAFLLHWRELTDASQWRQGWV